MNAFAVNVDLSGVLAGSPMASAGIFRNLSAAVERVAQAGAERWKEAVLRAPLWDGERRAYADSINVQMVGPYAAEIVSRYKYVQDIETGRPPYDMKRMLDTSMKVRVSKTGRRYLIIPFRHNSTGGSALARAMPTEIYEMAKELTASKVTGSSARVSGTGAFDVKTKQPFLVRKREYQWGGRLPAGLAPKLKPEHKTDAYAGMVRFDARTPGGKSYSTYLTFRVMAEGSPGWIIPARAGLHIARGIADGLRGDAESVFSAAIEADLAGASAAAE